MSNLNREGHVLSGEQAVVLARKKGLCPKCYQPTHAVVGQFWNKKLVALEKVKDSRGNVIVYKGHCTQPTCSSLNEVKKKLGERTSRTQRHSHTLVRPDNHSSEFIEIPFLPDPEPPADNKEGRGCDVSINDELFEQLPDTLAYLPLPESPLPNQADTSDSGSQTNLDVETQHDWSNNAIRVEMQDAATTGDFTLLFSLLERESKHANKGAIITALGLICKNVRLQMMQGNLYVFANDFWVKSLAVVIEDNVGDDDVLRMSVSTLAVLSGISDVYMYDISIRGGPKIILSILDKYKNDTEIVDICCCGIFCLIDRNVRGDAVQPVKSGILMNRELATRAVENLVSVIETASSTGKRWIFGALLNLTLQNLPSHDNRTIGNVIRDACEGSGINILISAINGDFEHSFMFSHALHLLTSLVASCDDNEELLFISEPLVTAIISIINCVDDHSCREGGLLLMGSLVCGPSSLSARNMILVSDVVAMSMSSFLGNEGLQIAAMKCVANLLRPSVERNEIQQWNNLVAAIVTAMNEYQKYLDVQCSACIALATIVSGSDRGKLAVAENGGVITVATAIEQHASLSQDNPDVDDLLLFGCTVLVSMAASHLTIPDLKNEKVMLALRYASKIGGRKLPKRLRMNVMTVLCDGTYTSREEFHDLIDREVDILFNVSCCETAEEQITKICYLCNCSSDALICLIVAKDCTCIAFLTSLMTRYERSQDIQEAVCDILWMIYSTFPFQGQLGMARQLAIGTGSFSVVTHSKEQIESIRKAIKIHKITKSSLVTKAFNCLTGFFLASADDEFDYSTELQSSFSGMYKDCVDALSVHSEVIDVLNSSMNLIRCLLLLRDELELRRWCSYLLDAILTNLHNHSEIEGTIINGSDTLGAIISIETEDGAIGLMDKRLFALTFWNCLLSDSEKVVEASLGLIAMAASRVVSLIEHFLESPEFCLRIVNCMIRYPDSSTIVESSCSIICSCSMIYDDRLMWTFVQSRGLQAILHGVVRHQHDDIVQQSAWQALSSLLGVAPAPLLINLKSRFGDAIVRSLRYNMTSAQTEVSILEIFCHLCFLDDRYKEFFTTKNAIAVVIEVMDLHLQERDVQIRGCTCLFALSTYDENHIKIGQCGGLSSIVNALLAHLTEPRLQKDGLEVLKNVATEARNKQTLRAYGAEDAIVTSMKGNLASEQIFAVALSALNNVAVCTKTKIVSAAPPGAFDCLLVGMRTHRTCAMVQSNACFLLKSYTFSQPSMDEMRSRAEEFTRVLMAAADAFPAECATRAYQVLDKILA